MPNELEDQPKTGKVSADTAVAYLRKLAKTKEYWIFLAFDYTGAAAVQLIYDRFYQNHPKHFPILMLP